MASGGGARLCGVCAGSACILACVTNVAMRALPGSEPASRQALLVAVVLRLCEASDHCKCCRLPLWHRWTAWLAYCIVSRLPIPALLVGVMLGAGRSLRPPWGVVSRSLRTLRSPLYACFDPCTSSSYITIAILCTAQLHTTALAAARAVVLPPLLVQLGV